MIVKHTGGTPKEAIECTSLPSNWKSDDTWGVQVETKK